MSDQTTKEIILLDVNELQYLMYLYILEEQLVFEPEYDAKKRAQLEKTTYHRCNYIKNYIDVVLYANSIWRLTADHTYDSYMEPVEIEYLSRELPHIEVDDLRARGMFEKIRRTILCEIPPKLEEQTWDVWSVSLVSTSLILRNDGDYRAIEFAKAAINDKEHPFYNKLNPEVLYQH